MKIAIVNFFGITPDVPGATKHYDMASFFQLKPNLDVEFWMSSVNYHTDKYVKGFKWYHFSRTRKDSSGLRLVYLRSMKHRNRRVLREISMIIFSVISGFRLLFSRKFDAVIISMPPVTPCGAIAAKFRKIPIIADVEDLWPLFLEESGVKNRQVLRYYEKQAETLYRLSTGIEAVSNGMLNYVMMHIDCTTKVCWLAPLGVNLDSYDHLEGVIATDKYAWINDFVVMYIGAHGLANDIDSVLHAIARFYALSERVNGKKVSFVFIGDGNHKRELLDLRIELELNNVYFEDAISSDLVPKALSYADVCLTNLRRLDCFKLVRPNKLFQYMAASKPIISGIWGESQDIINDAQVGITVDFTNHDQAAKEIMSFCMRDDLAALGESGNRYIRENGDRKVIFQEFYDRLIEVIKTKSEAS